MKPVPMTKLPTGRQVQRLGQGTWKMGSEALRRNDEVNALRVGLDLGMKLIDTAEMYSDGEAERIVGQAIAKRRDDVFLVTKVAPWNASRCGTVAACERSLRRLTTDRIDLYLLHWRETIPVSETVEAFSALQRSGKILNWGVSNFDIHEMEQLVGVTGGTAVASNQVMYSLKRRGIEHSLLPWCRQRRIPIMAYSPLDEGRLLRSRTLRRVAMQHRSTVAQVAIAWLALQPSIIVIPKAGNEGHVRENRKALDLRLSKDDLASLDAVFPPPRRKRPLEMT